MLHSSSILGEKEVMASKVLTILQDDLDGSDAKETVHFAIDGVEYEIDLSDRNANRLRNSLTDFITHGRRVSLGSEDKAGDTGFACPGSQGHEAASNENRSRAGARWKNQIVGARA